MSLNKTFLGTYINDNGITNHYWEGKVIDDEDPIQQSRVKVSIKYLTEGITKENLPWYSLATVLTSSPNAGAIVPTKGTRVVVQFPTGDIYNGIVSYQVVDAPPIQG